MNVEKKARQEMKKRPSKRLAEVYVRDERAPRPFEKGDIAGDLAWRREHSAPLSVRALRALLSDIGEEALSKAATIRYSRKCGCSMCPCSPGFVVLADEESLDDKRLVWLTLK